jgi:hypothetical protein
MKYKYIVVWFYTPKDSSGNVYSYGQIVDTRSGRILWIQDCPESNLTWAIADLNGEPKNNYYFIRSRITWKDYVRVTAKIPVFTGEIADAFRKMMKSRKKNLVKILG